MSALEQMMQTEPDCWEIKDSLRKIRKSYPEVYKIHPDLIDNLLSVSITVTQIRKPCPHCGDKITSPKGRPGQGRCPNCGNSIQIQNDSYSKLNRRSSRPSRNSSTSRSSSRTSRSSHGTQNAGCAVIFVLPIVLIIILVTLGNGVA